MNDLTEGELERLALLAEECAEVITIVGKILRHGYDSFNPDDPHRVCNRRLLQQEIGDVNFAVRLMYLFEDISRVAVANCTLMAEDNKYEYLYHQAPLGKHK